MGFSKRVIWYHVVNKGSLGIGVNKKGVIRYRTDQEKGT